MGLYVQRQLIWVKPAVLPKLVTIHYSLHLQLTLETAYLGDC
jgi:hypothetical protein